MNTYGLLPFEAFYQLHNGIYVK